MKNIVHCKDFAAIFLITFSQFFTTFKKTFLEIRKMILFKVLTRTRFLSVTFYLMTNRSNNPLPSLEKHITSRNQYISRLIQNLKSVQ